ncbi:MAG: OB-fold nucleic acid binding domain-containing protein, partial [Candidatus Nanoarchaeia archaeon]
MLHIPIANVIERIHQESGLSIEEIQDQIKAKIAKLEGLVSEEGAAYIVASELGVQLFKNADSRGPVKIRDLIAGVRSVEVIGKVTRVFAPKQFKTKDNREGEVASIVIADETGSTRAVLWDKKTSLIKDDKLKTGSIVKIKDAQVKQNNLGNTEIHVGSRSTIILDPKGVSITVKSTRDAKKVFIKDIKAGENVSIFGTVVQVFPPKFYPICSKCGKKVTVAPEGTICSEHKSVTAIQAMILNFVLDDCTDTL